MIDGGVVTDVRIDAHWAHGAHRSDLETELTEALHRARVAASPERLAHGPTGAASRAVQALAADPAALMKAVGLVP